MSFLLIFIQTRLLGALTTGEAETSPLCSISLQARSQDCKFGAASVFGGQAYFEYYYTAIAC